MLIANVPKRNKLNIHSFIDLFVIAKFSYQFIDFLEEEASCFLNDFFEFL